MAAHKPLRHVSAAQCSQNTAQSGGMTRSAGISATTVGATAIFMGQTVMEPATVSEAHHHGELETAIFVVEGSPVFRFLQDGVEQRIEAAPGDYVLVPPHTPHIEENPSPTERAVVVLARTGQEAIVVNLDSLHG